MARDREQSEYDDRRTRESEEYDSRESSGSGFTGARWLGVLVLFIAFVLMAFAAATPVTKKFYLFSVKIKVDMLIDKVTNDFRFGVWGYCTGGVKNSFGIGKAKINTSSKGKCHDRQLGWTFRDVPGMSDDLQDTIHGAMTAFFVLHIVAAVLIFLGLCFMVVSAAKKDVNSEVSEYRGKDEYDDQYAAAPKSRKKLRSLVFLIVTLAFVFTMGTFILDVAGVVLTKNKVHDKSKGMASLGFGPAFWFVVAAFGLVIISFLIALFDTVRSGKNTSRDVDATVNERSSGSNYSQSNRKYNDNDMDDVNLESPQDERRQY